MTDREQTPPLVVMASGLGYIVGTGAERFRPPPTRTMEPLNFSESTEDDLIEAQNSSLEIVNAIRDLQGTELWKLLPIATRRLVCGTHAHLCVLSDTINDVL